MKHGASFPLKAQARPPGKAFSSPKFSKNLGTDLCPSIVLANSMPVSICGFWMTPAKMMQHMMGLPLAAANTKREKFSSTLLFTLLGDAHLSHDNVVPPLHPSPFLIQVFSKFISHEKVARMNKIIGNLESTGVIFGASNTILILRERLFKFNRDSWINHFKSYAIAHELKVGVGYPILVAEFKMFTLFSYNPITISLFKPFPQPCMLFNSLTLFSISLFWIRLFIKVNIQMLLSSVDSD